MREKSTILPSLLTASRMRLAEQLVLMGAVFCGLLAVLHLLGLS